MELPGNEAGPAPVGAARGPWASRWPRYALGAARRRAVAVAAVFLVGAAASLATYRLSRPMYRVETRIMVQNQGFGALRRGPTAQEDAPIRSVFDLIHRRENLLALLRHAGVRPEAAGAADRDGPPEWLASGLALLAGGESTPENPGDALVRRLDKALVVTAVDGTITIAIDWPNADQAFKLVDGALQNFLEDRHVQEITMADEAVSLLQPRVAAARSELEKVSDEVRRATAEGEVARRSERPAMVQLKEEPSDDLVFLRAQLDTKERAIGDVEEIRRRRLTELQSQLDAQRAVLSDVHPVIINLRQDVAALSKESPQIAALREEANKLRAEFTARLTEGRRKPTLAPAAGGGYRPAPAVVPVEENERVRQARFQYQQMSDRLSGAQLERDAAGAAFKYRYVVSWPAELPHAPASPSAAKVLGLGLLGSILLAIGAATALELRRGRIVQRWQIVELLGLPILADQGRR